MDKKNEIELLESVIKNEKDWKKRHNFFMYYLISQVSKKRKKRKK